MTGPRMATLRAEMKVLRAEWSVRGRRDVDGKARGARVSERARTNQWSGWEPRRGRRSREGSGRELREAAEIQWAEKVRAKAAARS